MNIIFLASVQHSGTWYMIEFFKSLPEVTNFVELPVLKKSKTWLRREVSPGAWEHGLVSVGTNLVHAHITPEDMPMIHAMAISHPTVIPVRDPLLGVITGHNRYPAVDFSHIVRNWLLVAERFFHNQSSYQCVYVPVDLGATDKKLRHSSLSMAYSSLLDLGHFGPGPVNAWIEADEWPNSRGDYPLKRAYQAGDTKAIREAIPSEYALLVREEKALRPMFETLGYHDLLWWGHG